MTEESKKSEQEGGLIWYEHTDLKERVAKSIFYNIQSGIPLDKYVETFGVEHNKWMDIPEWERDDYRRAAKSVLKTLFDEQRLNLRYLDEEEKKKISSTRMNVPPTE